jgi:TolC family type I secretion outer membrane protein
VVLELNINNERVLARELEATQDRFEVGELTRTDVAQAESRLSRATSDRIGSENDLATSAAQFKNIIGIAPGDLEVPLPPEALLPFSSPDAIDMATTNNPDVISAEFREISATNDVDLIRGELLPEVTLDGVLSVDEDSSLVNGDRNRASITVNLRVPVYQSGSVYSRVREAKQVASLRMFDLADVLREAERAATDSWENLQGSRARAISFQSEVNAQEIALEGVTEEQRVGARTILDVLDAEQELLDARVGLVRAQRDALVDSYDLLSAVGRLTAEDLGLPVEVYDFTRNLDVVRSKLFGTDIGG